MKKLIPLLTVTILSVLHLGAQNPLFIPDTLSGTVYNLNVYDTSKVFFPGYTTITHGVNAAYLGPTLFLTKGDSVTLQVNNQMADTTTMHWHGLHVAAMNDGGPHMLIPPGTVWSPQFKVRDQASMYWYHPHKHMMTNIHVSKGAAGLIIVRDSAERALNLPRRYAVDDFPLVIQSKCFDAGKQIVIGNASDSVILVNGTYKALLTVPAQVVRLRLLNASSERVYNVGLQGNLLFYQIASDGGLLNAPVALTRLRLAPAERAEILVDLSGKTGQSIQLMSYAAELPNAIYGALQPGMGPGQSIPGYAGNVLNGANFSLMTFSVGAATASPVTNIPASLVTNTPWAIAGANAFKTLVFSPLNPGPGAIQGPFRINNTNYDMNVINYTIPFNNIEIWTLTNQSPIAHPFHIHDVQFYITEINGLAPPANMAGRKDVVLVPAGQSVKFITKFETFCDPHGVYLYHCHMLTHEDDGMMGQFVVSCPEGLGLDEAQGGAEALTVFPNPGTGEISLRWKGSLPISHVKVYDAGGRLIFNENTVNGPEQRLDLRHADPGIYLLEIRTRDGYLFKKLNLMR